MKRLFVLTPVVFFLVTFYSCDSDSDKELVKTAINVDACVYGANGAGINAAVALAREGFSVVILEPWLNIGGLMSTGFRMQQDVPYADHLGGLTGEFYQKDIDIPQSGLRHYQGASKYNVAFFYEMLNAYPDLIKLIKNHRLVSVNMDKGIIKEAIFEYAPPDKNGVPAPHRASDNLTSVKARIFIDASYEGDLMAYSGVSYRIGKESRSEYGESLAGNVLGADLNYFRRGNPGNDNKFPGVSPFVEEGNPKSGLLSVISPEPFGEEGDESRYFMPYNFKLSWETDPTEEFPGIPITPPENKNEDLYELLRRYTDAGYMTSWPGSNFSRGQLMTGSLPGMQVDYPDGSWADRAKVWQGHIDHVKTLTDFSGEDVRLLTDINEETNGWPFLYIRAGRRMIGEYVITQQDIQLQTDPPDPICLGYYKIDIYPCRLVVLEDGTLAQEGDIFLTAAPGPYRIPYGAIIPRRNECKNLLVPVMMSASHVAYSSIRMEATYMVMAESAGIAAALALKTNKAVQDIDREELTSMLKKYGQILEWDGKGYRKWRYNILSEPLDEITRWQTHPEEYLKYPVEKLWK